MNLWVTATSLEIILDVLMECGPEFGGVLKSREHGIGGEGSRTTWGFYCFPHPREFKTPDHPHTTHQESLSIVN